MSYNDFRMVSLVGHNLDPLPVLQILNVSL